MKRIIFSIILFFLAVSSAVGEPMPEFDIPFRLTTLHIAYDVNADGSYTQTQNYSGIVFKENALESAKKGSITFSTSVAKGEILEAYTIKKSGQRIDAPKNSYQVTISDGYKEASPLYSDETTIEVVFPDLAVGDTFVFSARITNSEGIFPNQFSIAHSFSRFTAYDDASVEVTAPVAMDLKYQNYFLTEQKPVIKDGKQTLRWTYQNRIPQKWTPSDKGISIVGADPSLYVSTFKSYKDIAEAYGTKAIPKAAVTDRIKKLAGEIVADKNTPELQARAIYDWVTKNISYGGNCIGIGAVVPRDLDIVLDNKMGDCKDHATLLQALLSSRNIESEQALINAGDLYDLPGIPVVSTVNHVINYLPRMNLFLDSTPSTIPYAMLPIGLDDKPALLVSHYKEGMKTPSMSQYGHEQRMKTTIWIKPDGSATGETEITMKGIPAITARALMRQIPTTQEEYLVKTLLDSQGLHGTGTLKKDDPTPLLDTYKLSVSFKLDDFVTVGTATGMLIRPVIGIVIPIEAFLKEAYDALPNKRHICSGGMSNEEYILEFPESLKIIAVPKDFEFSNTMIDYKATYRKSDNTLVVRRELKDKTATSTCTPEYAAEYKKAILNVAKDLKSQILLSD